MSFVGLGRRVVATALSAGMAIGMQAVTAAPTFAAMPPPPSYCNWGDTFWSIGNTGKPYDITHAAGITIPPGWTYSNTASLQRTDTITSVVTGTVSGTVEANDVISKVGVTMSLSLQSSGSTTVTSSVSDTWSYHNTGTTTKNFVLYTAPHKVTAGWQYWQCTRFDAWTMTASGSMTSWDIEYKGVADCSATYSNTSAQGIAKSRYCF